MNAFEDVLEEIGSFGPFQIRLFLLVSAFETPAAWAMLLPVFTSARSSWTCSDSSNDSYTKSFNFSYNCSSNSTCGPHSIFNNGSAGSCDNSGGVCTDRTYLADFTSIVTEWDLVCGREYIASLITTIQMVGVLLGACITGQLADTYGRRKVFFIVYSLLLLAGFMSAFANSWQLYATTRFLIGAFFGGTMLVNFVLPLEFVGPRWRTFCGCIGFWACGVMTLALLAFFIREWRYLTIATSSGGIFLLFTWWCIPESPRWLIQKGRFTEASDIITQMAKFNKKPVPDLSKLQNYIKDKNNAGDEKKYSYCDLFGNVTMAKNTLILTYAWFVSSSVYYGTSLNIRNLTGDKYINFFLSGLVEIPGLIFVVLVNNRFGRRITLCGLMMLSGISMIAILFVDLAGQLDALPKLTVSLALLGRSGIAGGWAAAQVYSAEVFPTVIRNIGVGACSMSSRIGGIAAPQIVFLNKFSQPLPYVIFGGLAGVCGILSIFLPETLNKPLPEHLPTNCCTSRGSTRRGIYELPPLDPVNDQVSNTGVRNGTVKNNPPEYETVSIDDNQD